MITVLMTVKNFSHETKPLIIPVDQKYRFKLHHTTGPSIYLDIDFTIAEPQANCSNKICVVIDPEVEITDTKGAYLAYAVDIETYFTEPSTRGIVAFTDYCAKINFSIVNPFAIKLHKFRFHPVDSKPISSQVGIDLALKTMFSSQTGYHTVSKINLAKLK